MAESYAHYVLDIRADNDEQQARTDWFARFPDFQEARQRAAQRGYGDYETQNSAADSEPANV